MEVWRDKSLYAFRERHAIEGERRPPRPLPFLGSWAYQRLMLRYAHLHALVSSSSIPFRSSSSGSNAFDDLPKRLESVTRLMPTQKIGLPRSSQDVGSCFQPCRLFELHSRTMEMCALLASHQLAELYRWWKCELHSSNVMPGKHSWDA